MSLSLLKSRSKQIARSAFIATFVDSTDENNVIEKFSSTWSEKFSQAIYDYVAICIGLPTGGPVTSGQTTKLKQDIYNAAKDALKSTYLSSDYDNDVENDFASELSNVVESISSYMSTVATTPAAPPTIPVSPGGPLIASASTICVAAFNTCSHNALLASFPEGDVGGIASIFSSIFQETGQTIGEYVMTCTSSPGGGPLIPSN